MLIVNKYLSDIYAIRPDFALNPIDRIYGVGRIVLNR